MKSFPRTPPRLDLVFSPSPVYFVTCCTYRRRAVLANREVHEAFLAYAGKAWELRRALVGRYVIMPDHIHLFIAGNDDFILGKWFGGLKQAMGKTITRGSSRDPLWQRGFFDHLLRSEESYAQKWEYVSKNPVRAGLVASAADWPYAGEVAVIDRL